MYEKRCDKLKYIVNAESSTPAVSNQLHHIYYGTSTFQRQVNVLGFFFAFFLGGGGSVNHGCHFPAYLQNSCDNMDRVAMEIGPVLRVGNNEDLRFEHSSQTDSSLFTHQLLHWHNKATVNLHELRT